ncbi:hal kinase [Trichoderma arundinaceum]|uniref:non-specific serine/threonine protein kinase n=1 Tax=Trichoderma arundinaceum TaxID=490622 RepID=A0A395NN18_TRIAR|nr:hal kinase [Trichoderma arundinaceum]
MWPPEAPHACTGYQRRCVSGSAPVKYPEHVHIPPAGPARALRMPCRNVHGEPRSPPRRPPAALRYPPRPSKLHSHKILLGVPWDLSSCFVSGNLDLAIQPRSMASSAPQQAPFQQEAAADAAAAPGDEISRSPSKESTSSKPREGPGSVRFSSAVEEIEPTAPPLAEPAAPLTATTNTSDRFDTFNEVAADQIKAFQKSLHGLPLQERRMSTFGFEAFSLPASRLRDDINIGLRPSCKSGTCLYPITSAPNVCIPDSSPHASGHPKRSLMPVIMACVSSPCQFLPRSAANRDALCQVNSREDGSNDSTRLPTPNSSGWQSPHGSPRLSALASPPLTPAGSDPDKRLNKEAGATGATGSSINDSHIITPQPSTSTEKTPAATADRKVLVHRPASSDHAMSRASSTDDQRGDSRALHRKDFFSVGPSSVPVSRESSPSRSSASYYYSKPMTPGGDANDPYAKGRRPPQQQHPTRHSVDPRFVFSRKKKHGHGSSPTSSKTSLGAYSHSKHSDDSGSNDGVHAHAATGSMSDLKRFFRKSGHHKRRDQSPSSIKSSSKSSQASRSTQQLPFGDDHGLTSKYGKLGKVLGSGAGGSVRLMRRTEDGTVFAVKEFRARHTYETEREYNKKVTAEFCVGSTLHHGNVIETLDILQEKGRWFEVMEYAPFDLFAIVMTGKMSREEIRCSFLQILNGVTYLHSMGLAHRDLKLDNVVVSDKGIMKIIDFGSAHVFKYPFESGSVPAKGIVGSDPYLAPEVYDSKEYNAEEVDIWSLAIIFCCMTLRRFPWKIPRMTDNSYKLFAANPTPGHDPGKLLRPKSTNDLSSVAAREFLPDVDDPKPHNNNNSSHRRQGSDATTAPEQTQLPIPGVNATVDKREVIRGPWRILRLLPRESRHIIHRMLDVNPKSRARMGEILEEPWVADTVICQQVDNGDVIPASDHKHILEPPNAQPPPPKKA